jgi:hypothetical protein
LTTSIDSTGNDLLPICKICDAPVAFFGTAEVLRKHTVKYFRCEECGFIQTEAPYWLEEAYSSAIARQDVGIMQRNLINWQVSSAVLKLLFPRASNGIDFGAGHGIFVRLMRDSGFDFSWSDLHAANDYARGFEYKQNASFDFLTSFEVLEHLVDPISGVNEMMNLSDNVLVSTCLVPDPPPRLGEWWYFVPSTGQHISFYTEKSLGVLAARFGRHLVSANPYHIFTRDPLSSSLFRLCCRVKIARLFNLIYRRKSLIDSDFQKMMQ